MTDRFLKGFGPTFLAFCVALTGVPGAEAVVLLNENFDGLPFETTVERAAGTENAWTKTPPVGWEIDDSQMPGTLGGADDGVREYYGWNFLQKSLFVVPGQSRDEFTLASGGLAVADPDEWDDGPNPDSLYNTFLNTPVLSLGGARALTVRFDSSWRPEGFDDLGNTNNQTATVVADFGLAGGQTASVEALRWDSDPNGAFFTPDSTNESVTLSLIAPAGAQTVSLNFGLTEAYNDWWWAFDNLVVETFNPVVLEVDTATGGTRLLGTADSAVSREMFSYQISSPSGSLTPAAWGATNLDAQDVGAGGGPGDFNGDGSIDAADYTVWRDGAAPVQGPAGYALWAANYGATGGGVGSDWDTVVSEATALSEAFLLGEEFLDGGFSMSLGSAFLVGGQQDLRFEYAGPDGTVTEALVVYVNSAASAATGIPEPSTLSLGAIIMGLLFGNRRRGFGGGLCPKIATLGFVAALAAAPSAEAAFTLDRDYRLGENDTLAGGPATVGTRIGQNGAGDANDSAGVPNSQGGSNQVITLTPVAGNGPIYRSTATRPFASPGEIGIEFTNSFGADALRAEPLGSPGESVSSASATSSLYATGVGPFDYDGVTNRGMQFWTRPSRTNVDQVIVYDTDQHVVGISAGGRWFMQYDAPRPAGRTIFGAVTDRTIDTTIPESLAQANQWYHVMLVRPYGATRKIEDPVDPAAPPTFDSDVSSGPNGGARLYINGVAVAAETGGFNTGLEFNFGTGSFRGDSILYVGGFGATPASGAFQGITNPYLGILDDLEMFVLGTSVNGTGWGNFDLATDNGFIAQTLAGIGAADLNRDGTENAADVTAFVNGWLSQNLVNGIVVGDLRSRARGDVNFDGRVDLLDWRQINLASPASGTAIGQALGFIAIPEPAGLALAGAVALVGGLRGRRR